MPRNTNKQLLVDIVGILQEGKYNLKKKLNLIDRNEILWKIKDGPRIQRLGHILEDVSRAVVEKEREYILFSRPQLFD